MDAACGQPDAYVYGCTISRLYKRVLGLQLYARARPPPLGLRRSSGPPLGPTPQPACSVRRHTIVHGAMHGGAAPPAAAAQAKQRSATMMWTKKAYPCGWLGAATASLPAGSLSVLLYVMAASSSLAATRASSKTGATRPPAVEKSCPLGFALCRAGSGYVVSSTASAGAGAGLTGTYTPVQCPNGRIQGVSRAQPNGIRTHRRVECYGRPVYHRNDTGRVWNDSEPAYYNYGRAFLWYGRSKINGRIKSGVWTISEPLDPRSIDPCNDWRDDDNSFCTSLTAGIQSAFSLSNCLEGPHDQRCAGHWSVSERTDVPRIVTLPNGESVATFGGQVVVAPDFTVSPLVCSDGSPKSPDRNRCTAAPGFWKDFDGTVRPCTPVRHQHSIKPGLTCTHPGNSRVRLCRSGYTKCSPTLNIVVSGGTDRVRGTYVPLVNVTCYGKQVYQSAYCGQGDTLGIDRFPPAVLYFEALNPSNPTWMIQKLQKARHWLKQLPRTGICGDSGSASSYSDDMFGRWKETPIKAGGEWKRSDMTAMVQECNDGTTPDQAADKCTKAAQKGASKSERHRHRVCPPNFTTCRAGTGFIVSPARGHIGKLGSGLRGIYTPVYCANGRVATCFGKPVYHSRLHGHLDRTVRIGREWDATDKSYGDIFMWYGNLYYDGTIHKGVWQIHEAYDSRLIDPCGDDSQSFCTAIGGPVEGAFSQPSGGCTEGPDSKGCLGQWMVTVRADTSSEPFTDPDSGLLHVRPGPSYLMPDFRVIPLKCSDGSAADARLDKCTVSAGFWVDHNGAAQPCPKVPNQHAIGPGLTCKHQHGSRVKACAPGYVLCPATDHVLANIKVTGSRSSNGIYKPLVNVTCHGRQVYLAGQTGDGTIMNVDLWPASVMYFCKSCAVWMIQSEMSARRWLTLLPRTGMCGDGGHARARTADLFGSWLEIVRGFCKLTIVLLILLAC